MIPIFTEEFLKPHIANFRLAAVSGIRQIIQLIKAWQRELHSGKLQYLKEEEIKSRFINTFFGDILGFAYGTSQYWHLREEKKTKVDGTKPDAALGYFGLGEDDVRIVVEIKKFTTDLDARQNRPGKPTPVDQAFNYAPKMGGECKWVILSNMNEIRIYYALDRTKYQKYSIDDLTDESKLKEFLLLFHRDRFIKKESLSTTEVLFDRNRKFEGQPESPYHIIDELYASLKRFEGLRFVDPKYIASIAPFNIQQDYVWHYHYYSLFTINTQIYHLLKNIEIKPDEVIISDILQKEIITQHVVDVNFKISWILNFLNHCMISQIEAVKNYKEIEVRNKHTIGFSIRHSFNFREDKEGIIKKVWIQDEKVCDCLSCNFRDLNFKSLAEKLRIADGNADYNTLEYAYGHYLMGTQNFKTTYKLYKSLEERLKGEEGKDVEYFLVKYNMRHLYNLVSDYELEDSVEILNSIKAIDLNRVLYEELAFDIDEDVRSYLAQVKEDELIFKIQDEIEENLQEIKRLRAIYENGDTQTGPAYHDLLVLAYFKLYQHINQNYLIYDCFYRYKHLTEKMLNGLIDSYLTPKAGIDRFNEFILTEAILHIAPQKLEKLVDKIKTINVEENVVPVLLKKLKNFLNSYMHKSFGRAHKERLLQEFLQNYRFKNRYTNIFSNLLLVLSKLDIKEVEFLDVKSLLIDFIDIEDELSWSEIRQLGRLIEYQGKLFSMEELTTVLTIAINRDTIHFHKYTNFINSICRAISKQFPAQLLTNSRLVEIAVLNNYSEDSVGHSLREIICLLDIFKEDATRPLTNKLDLILQEKFSIDLYERLLRTRLAHYFLKYFENYVLAVSKSKGRGTYKYGKFKLTDVVYINFILTTYSLNMDVAKYESYFEDLNSFEKWLLKPARLDLFEPKWLIDLHFEIILNSMANIPGISEALEIQLQEEYNSILAEIRYTYFNKVLT